jgi:hypothetical protein
MPDPIEQLRQLVLGDRPLLETLLAITDRREFAATLAAVASERGVQIGTSDITAAVGDARRCWLKQWV